MIRSANHSSFPKVGEHGLDQQLRIAERKFERGEIDADQLRQTIVEVTTLCVADQARSFVGIVSDGMMGWIGPHEHLIDRTGGLLRGPLIRWFETNLYQRQLVVSGELVRREPYALDGFNTAKSVALKQTVKVTLPGPVTLARLADDRHYGDFDSLVDAFAAVLREEVQALAESGADAFQLDEPMLCRRPEDLERVIRSVSTVFEAAGEGAMTILSTYFGDPGSVADDWNRLPGTHLGIETLGESSDFAYLDKLPENRGVYLGCFDAGTTRQEDADEVARSLMPYRDTLERRDVIVGPNAGLESLPRDFAFDKLLHARYVAEQLGREWTWSS